MAGSSGPDGVAGSVSHPKRCRAVLATALQGNGLRVECGEKGGTTAAPLSRPGKRPKQVGAGNAIAASHQESQSVARASDSYFPSDGGGTTSDDGFCNGVLHFSRKSMAGNLATFTGPSRVFMIRLHSNLMAWQDQSGNAGAQDPAANPAGRTGPPLSLQDSLFFPSFCLLFGNSLPSFPHHSAFSSEILFPLFLIILPSHHSAFSSEILFPPQDSVFPLSYPPPPIAVASGPSLPMVRRTWPP